MTKAFSPALVWLAIIVFLSTKGGIPAPDFNLFQTDKLAHAAAYFLLTWLILWGTTRWLGRVHWSQGLTTVLFTTAFGAFMEYVQFKFFPDRLFEYDDMLANGIGALLGWLFFVKIFHGQSGKKCFYSHER